MEYCGLNQAARWGRTAGWGGIGSKIAAGCRIEDAYVGPVEEVKLLLSTFSPTTVSIFTLNVDTCKMIQA